VKVKLHLFGETGKWKYDSEAEVGGERYELHKVLAVATEPLPGLTVSAASWLLQGGYIVLTALEADGSESYPRLILPEPRSPQS
jgi:hypothetical protein